MNINEENFYPALTNKEYAEKRCIPYYDYLGMCVYLRCKVVEDESTYASCAVTTCLLKLLNLAQDDEEAIEYVKKRIKNCSIKDFTLKDIRQSLEDIIHEEDTNQDCYDQSEMLVLTNKEKHYGSAIILNTDILDKVCSLVGSDLIILPSSVHEVLILRKKQSPQIQDLRTMVSEVNATLTTRELLSDNVFVYEAEEKQLKIA